MYMKSNNNYKINKINNNFYVHVYNQINIKIFKNLFL